MIETDPTMKALLGVYRAELAERDAEIERLTFNATVAEDRADRAEREKGTALDHRDRALEGKRVAEDRAEKLLTIIETLKIELQGEREAHTTLKDEHRQLTHLNESLRIELKLAAEQIDNSPIVRFWTKDWAQTEEGGAPFVTIDRQGGKRVFAEVKRTIRDADVPDLTEADDE